jgi:hypothetical protein
MSYKITDENIEDATNAYRTFVQRLGPKRYMHTSDNLITLGDYLERNLKDGEMITVEHWLKAWLESSGLLQEPPTEAELKTAEEKKVKERNARLEAQDRRAGASFVDSNGNVCTRHMSDSEREEMMEAAEKQSKEDYKKALEWVRGKAEAKNQPKPLGPSAIDVANELSNILNPVTIATSTAETKRALTKWMRANDSQLVITARRNNPDLVVKMDKILLKTFEADL